MSWSEYTHFVFCMHNPLVSYLDGSAFIAYSSGVIKEDEVEVV
jgi:hypothetical protein